MVDAKPTIKLDLNLNHIDEVNQGTKSKRPESGIHLGLPFRKRFYLRREEMENATRMKIMPIHKRLEISPRRIVIPINLDLGISIPKKIFPLALKLKDRSLEKVAAITLDQNLGIQRKNTTPKEWCRRIPVKKTHSSLDQDLKSSITKKIIHLNEDLRISAIKKHLPIDLNLPSPTKKKVIAIDQKLGIPKKKVIPIGHDVEIPIRNENIYPEIQTPMGNKYLSIFQSPKDHPQNENKYLNSQLKASSKKKILPLPEDLEIPGEIKATDIRKKLVLATTPKEILSNNINELKEKSNFHVAEWKKVNESLIEEEIIDENNNVKSVVIKKMSTQTGGKKDLASSNISFFVVSILMTLFFYMVHGIYLVLERLFRKNKKTIRS